MPKRKKCIMFCVVLSLTAILGVGCRNGVSGAEEVLQTEAVDLPDTDTETGSETVSGSAADELRKQSDRENTQEISQQGADKSQPDTSCTVYVCGAVNTPGVYKLPSGSRVYEALEAAGGVCPDADAVFLNRAQQISDGQQIYVPTVEEARELDPSQAPVQAASTESGDGKVNLNTASKEELMTLTGIGEAKADSILLYREEHGRFTSIDELMQIPGIKEGVFQKIRDSITVA